MLFKIAWRNIWRKKTRSLIIIFAVTLGIWAGLVVSGFMSGVMNGMMESSINHYFSHIQIHNPDFKANNEIQFTIKDAPAVIAGIEKNAEVKSASGRSIAYGMAASPTTASGVKISGIDPVQERQVTHFDIFVKEGSYFGDHKRNAVLIGQKLAKKLGVKLHSKIVLTFSGPDGNIASGAFRVGGIYKSENSQMDGMNIFVEERDMNLMTGKDSGIHEIALTIKDVSKLESVKAALQKQFPSLKIETWKDLSPETATLNDYVGFILWILMSVMMIGLAFAIINTMLMAIMERTRELGMLMAIGMNKGRTFRMVMIETILLTFIGCPPGVFSAWATITYLGKHGLNLASFSKGMENFGMSAMVYPGLKDNAYFQVAILVLITAIAAAVYPSFRAIRLKPSEAIRKI